MTNELCFSSIAQLGALIDTGEVSPSDIVAAHLAQIERTEPVLNAYITVTAERATEQAARTTEEISRDGRRSPVHGIPFALKDVFHTTEVRTTAGAAMFDGFAPPSDSTLGARLDAAGAILLGKQNLEPLAYGFTSQNPYFGDIVNPWDPTRIAGGSSSGSSASAAVGTCPINLGTDTGGSVRMPAALCGVVGLKPTYGMLSRHGVFGGAWSLDQAGPIVRTVEDAATVLDVLVGLDPKDPTTVPPPRTDYAATLRTSLEGVVIGYPREYFEDPLEPGVVRCVQATFDVFTDLGAEVREVSWPGFHDTQAIYGTVRAPEASALYEAQLREDPTVFPPGVRERLEAGYYISAPEYLQAQRARAAMIHELHTLFADVDVLIGPMTTATAAPHGAPLVDIGVAKITAQDAYTRYGRPYSTTGVPAMSVPCGFSDNGMPVGLQIAARYFAEDTILSVGHAYQVATDWHTRRPALAG